jgi:hypothetical protein
MAGAKPRRGRPRKFKGEAKSYLVRLSADLYSSVQRLAASETRQAKKVDENAAVTSINDVITKALERWVASRK